MLDVKWTDFMWHHLICDVSWASQGEREANTKVRLSMGELIKCDGFLSPSSEDTPGGYSFVKPQTYSVPWLKVLDNAKTWICRC